MSFLIERLLEIFSSIVDCWIMWPNASTETGIRRYFPPIDKKTTEKYDTPKRLAFTLIGFGAAWQLISLLGVDQVGLLHTSGLVKAGVGANDQLFTALAICGGTGPIHSFFDSLQKYGKSDGKSDN